MKFGKRMEEEMVEQWAEHYVYYKRLKKLISQMDPDETDFSQVSAAIYEEMTRAENLFTTLLDELQQRHDDLLDQDPDIPIVSVRRSSRFYHKRVKKNRNKGTSKTQEYGGILVNPDPNDPSTTALEMRNDSGAGRISGGSSYYEESSGYSDASTRASAGIQVKNFFLRMIGDSAATDTDRTAPRGVFVEWYTHAHQLQHFAELNLEALRKTVKKLRKLYPNASDAADDLEMGIARSRMVVLMPRLHNLMSGIETDYQRKFKDVLDRYGDVSLISGTWYAKWRYVFLAIALFCLFMYVPILETHQPAHNCLALFVLIIVLWVTEAIPFFCTAMVIPIVAVPLNIIQDPDLHRPAVATVSSGIILGKVFNDVQILVLGGLTIGKALGRTNLEVYAASALHKLTSHRPSLYLLGVMTASCILCAFVSNVAAPLLVLGVIQPTLWEFPEDCKAPQAILLGLAFACNVGGMLSPIASPQNAVAMSVLASHNVSFGTWVGVSIPVVVFMIFVEWVYILLAWKPFKDVQFIPLQVVNVQANKQSTNVDRAVVIFVSLVTIVLWIVPAKYTFGDTGVVALIPIVVFFGIGILTKEDFNTLSWHLMFLLAGGNMLGLCARDSSMLDVIANGLKSQVTNEAPYITLLILVVVVAVVTTFVSHTVAAMILLPIVEKIGLMLPPPEGAFTVSPATLVMICALMCSGAMAFPISSFPNINSLLAENAAGKPYLQAKDFLISGSVMTLVFFLCLISWMVPLTYAILGNQ